ncbi:MAG: hypothetical protein ABIN91_17180 [Mucilaginibacter sp.]|uniref:hypothetical protein n=1 Tax=Mucilaginibacter sp. TaxID=1882438 RepID=UPI003263022D
MKKLMIMSAIAMSGLMYQTANAQIGVHFNINLGVRPVVVQQAPVYDADYYYLPEVEAYYSVSQHCYYYQDGGRWTSAVYLPGAYRNYDWQHANHYAVRESRPYLHNDVYRARYGGFEGRRDWNNRDNRSTVYANRDRVDHNQYRGNDYGRNQQNNNRGNYGDRNDHQQPQQNNNRGNYGDRNDHQQPQQNDNRGNVAGRNDHQQAQQNDNRGSIGGRNDHQQAQPQNNDRGNNRGNDNNRGGNDSRQGRSGRI